MKIQERIKDQVTLVVLAGLLLGCYVTTHRGPRTLDPGQVSVSGGYLRIKGTDVDPADKPNELIGLEGRIGIAPGLDIGLMRTVDISEEVDSPDEGIDTGWLDAKLQVLNRKNALLRPTMAIGYAQGIVLNEEGYVHSLYLLLGTQTERASIFYSFRVEGINEELFGGGYGYGRCAHILGLEFEILPAVKPVVELGRFHDMEESFFEGENVFTVGVNLLYAPKVNTDIGRISS